MKVIDPGHEYLLDSYDGGEPVPLVFMKREGEGYPFNVGHHPGTNCQEVLRVLIDRVKYLQKQIPCDENHGLLTHLRGALFCLEYRAARRHGRLLHLPSENPPEIEDYPTCSGCGHIGCEGHHKAAPTPVQPPAAPQDEPDGRAVRSWDAANRCVNCDGIIYEHRQQWYHASSGYSSCGRMAVAIPVPSTPTAGAGARELAEKICKILPFPHGTTLPITAIADVISRHFPPTEATQVGVPDGFYWRGRYEHVRANAIRECVDLAKSKAEEYHATAERYAEAKRETLPEAKAIDEDSRDQCFAKYGAMIVFAADLKSLAKGEGDDGPAED